MVTSTSVLLPSGDVPTTCVRLLISAVESLDSVVCKSQAVFPFRGKHFSLRLGKKVFLQPGKHFFYAEGKEFSLER